MVRAFPARLVFDIQQLLERHQPLEPLVCCDGCLALHFAVSLEEATAAALKVASEPGFQRRPGTCELCKRTLELTSVAPKRRIAQGQ